MTWHEIRLRGPWDIESSDFDRLGGRGRRLHLPAIDPPEIKPEGSICLRRGFQRPPRRPSGESCRLRLDHVPGLDRIELNGHDLTPPGLDRGELRDCLDIAIEPFLLPRNTLRLSVSLEGWRSGVEPDRPWGSIILLFGNVDPGQSG